MNPSFRSKGWSATVLVAPLAAALLLAPLDAAALSRKEQAAVDALSQRMQAAETRYRDAIVQARNADPDAQKQADAALEDMEDVMAGCARQRGCPTSTLLATYKRLLKLNVDQAGDDEDDGDADEGDSYGDDLSGVAADVPEAARAAHLLSDDHRFDKMVQYNPAVQAAIRRWLTDMRGALVTSHENYQYMRHLMWPQFQRAGLPEALLFGILAKESNGRVHSTSRAGAAGPMQFMFATGKRFGLGDDGTGFDTRYDPRSAAEASAGYLNERMRELNRSIELGLAAYNGGEGRARRIYNEGGANFWSESVYNQFPPETRDYVPMVIAAAWLYLHPREYGLSFPKVDPRPAPLRLLQPTSIYQLTICLGNAGTREGYMRALRNLNPRYEAESLIPSGTTLNATARIVGLYSRHCVQGRRAELARALVNSDPGAAIVRVGGMTSVTGGGPVSSANAAAKVVAPGVPATTIATGRPAPVVVPTYTVQTGETLNSIARKFQCDVAELGRANGLVAPRYSIRPGQALRLAGCRDTR